MNAKITSLGMAWEERNTGEVWPENFHVTGEN
jgi:hypothetical protein